MGRQQPGEHARLADLRLRPLRFIATRGRWADIPGYGECEDQRDCFNLVNAVREWLAEVDECFPAPTVTG